MITKKLYTSLVNSSMGTTKNNVYIWLQRNFTLQSILQCQFFNGYFTKNNVKNNIWITKKLYTSLVNSSMGTTKNNVYIWLQRNFTLHLSILQWVPLKIMFTYDYKETLQLTCQLFKKS